MSISTVKKNSTDVEQKQALLWSLDTFVRIGCGHLEDFVVLYQAGLLVDANGNIPSEQAFYRAMDLLMSAKKEIFGLTELNGNNLGNTNKVFTVAAQLKDALIANNLVLSVAVAKPSNNVSASPPPPVVSHTPATPVSATAACLNKVDELPSNYLLSKKKGQWVIYHKDPYAKRLVRVSNSTLLDKVVDDAIAHNQLQQRLG